MISLKELRVGVIGCGWIAQSAHIPAYVENQRSRLVAICDVNEERLKKVAMKYKGTRLFSDYRELLESNLVDAVSICTPTATHSKVAIAAAENGIHTLCEKPLASNLSEAREIAEAVSQSKIKFMAGFNYRFLPNHVKAKKIVDTGKIGKPILIRGEVVAPGPYRPDICEEDRPYEAEKRIGAFFDLGCHIADLFLWMMGEVKDVFANFATHVDNTTVDDTATALLKFRSGVLGVITVAWLHLPDYQAITDNRMIEIIGSKGKVESELFGPSLYFYGLDSITSKIMGKVRITPVKLDPRLPDEAMKWSYKKEIDTFLECIVRDKEPRITVDQAIDALKVIESAYASAKTRSAINLE